MTVTAAQLYDVIDGTWPAAQIIDAGPWRVRIGAGGGSRVSAATANGPITQADIAMMEQTQRDNGQSMLVMVRDGEDELDALLDQNGYRVVDPVTLYTAPVEQIAAIAPPIRMFTLWEPMEIQRKIWRSGGLSDARFAVMDRAPCVKTSILSRWDDHPAAAAYVGIHEGIAMIHAVEVLKSQRGKGVGAWVMRTAALWAQRHGAYSLSLVVTRANVAGNALYQSLGMQVVGQYHYRKKGD